MIQLLFFGLLLHARAADTEEKKKLTQVVVNTTSTEELTNTTSACLRAEFTAEILLPGADSRVALPALGNENALNRSDCGMLSLSFTLGEDDQAQQFELDMQFEEYLVDEKEAWKVKDITLSTAGAKYYNASLEWVGAPLIGTYGQSFLCTAGFDIVLPQDDFIGDGPVFAVLNLGRLQLQPFKVPQDTFANPVICAQDISVVVPAIVGSILGLLVIIVLITYVIGRRRTRIAYQEI